MDWMRFEPRQIDSEDRFLNDAQSGHCMNDDEMIREECTCDCVSTW